ncbi:MAG: prepilin-type N-terminal cleavage/methylation domain-containing protein [Pedosphaera sp.]|nr:prepilin-type N-terminal cleavage/methylation domain-containing protein [Pedosphaera sp.]
MNSNCSPMPVPGFRSPAAVSRCAGAFTLIEMLIVIAIIGTLAVISGPALKGLGKTNARSAAQRQILDDLGFARQSAVKNRTTVWMVFVPPNGQPNAGGSMISQQYQVLSRSGFFSALTGPYDPLKQVVLRSFTNTVVSQLTGYTIISRSGVGDQPGRARFKYLTDWRTLPDGMIFPSFLFNRFSGPQFPAPLKQYPNYLGMSTNWLGLPFPTLVDHPVENLYDRQFVSDKDFDGGGLPAIGFGPNGQIVMGPPGEPMNRTTRKGGMPPTDVYLAIAEGSVFVPKLSDGRFDLSIAPDSVETPKDNWTNSIIRISNLTGRARLIKPEFAQ